MSRLCKPPPHGDVLVTCLVTQFLIARAFNLYLVTTQSPRNPSQHPCFPSKQRMFVFTHYTQLFCPIGWHGGDNPFLCDKLIASCKSLWHLLLSHYPFSLPQSLTVNDNLPHHCSNNTWSMIMYWSYWKMLAAFSQRPQNRDFLPLSPISGPLSIENRASHINIECPALKLDHLSQDWLKASGSVAERMMIWGSRATASG